MSSSPIATPVAHRDPGVDDWLDTEGRESAMIFWRFMIPKGSIEPIRIGVVDVESLK